MGTGCEVVWQVTDWAQEPWNSEQEEWGEEMCCTTNMWRGRVVITTFSHVVTSQWCVYTMWQFRLHFWCRAACVPTALVLSAYCTVPNVHIRAGSGNPHVAHVQTPLKVGFPWVGCVYGMGGWYIHELKLELPDSAHWGIQWAIHTTYGSHHQQSNTTAYSYFYVCIMCDGEYVATPHVHIFFCAWAHV